jgi:hypothetical protein
MKAGKILSFVPEMDSVQRAKMELYEKAWKEKVNEGMGQW